MLSMLLKRWLSERGAGYPDEADLTLWIPRSTEGGKGVAPRRAIAKRFSYLNRGEQFPRANASHGDRVHVPVGVHPTELVLAA
jgi:hypothetical protein